MHEGAVRACPSGHMSRQAGACHSHLHCCDKMLIQGCMLNLAHQSTAQTVGAAKSTGAIDKGCLHSSGRSDPCQADPKACHSKPVFFASADCLLWGQLCRHGNSHNPRKRLELSHQHGCNKSHIPGRGDALWAAHGRCCAHARWVCWHFQWSPDRCAWPATQLLDSLTSQ